MSATREDEDKSDDNEIASVSEMNNLFRSQISDIPYAWQVVRILREVEKKFLANGKVTVSQVKQIASNITKILQDSSRSIDAEHLIQLYLWHDSVERFLQETKELADVVTAEAAKIDFDMPREKTKALFAEGMQEIQIPNSRIAVERDREIQVGQDSVIKSIQSEINVNMMIIGAWKKETSKAGHDFRIIGSRTPVEMVDLACRDCKARLKDLCALVIDVLTLRQKYQAKRQSLWSSEIAPNKLKTLESIEAKLAEIMDGIQTLDAAGVYRLLRTTLVNESEKITKSGKLKSLIDAVVVKYDPLIEAELRNDPKRRMGM